MMRRISLTTCNQDGSKETLIIKPSVIAYFKAFKSNENDARSIVCIEQSNFRFFCSETEAEIEQLLEAENKAYMAMKEELRIRFIEASSGSLVQ